MGYLPVSDWLMRDNEGTVTPANRGVLAPRTSVLLDRAEALCDARGVRLTGLRRQVLGLILETPDAPTGAYDLLDRLRAHRGGAAPPTVYRALEFLQEHGFVHRLERLSAFVGCVDDARARPCRPVPDLPQLQAE